MDKIQKAILKDIFYTISRIAEDCAYELEEMNDENKEDVWIALEVKKNRLESEIGDIPEF